MDDSDPVDSRQRTGVQRPQGSVSIIRGVGSTVIFYDWLPGAAEDPAAPGIQAALETLGVGYPVAS